MPFQRQLILNRLSPFEFARYAGKFADTRTLQIGFKQRVKDTYWVYRGGTDLLGHREGSSLFNPVEAETTPGLIDYATLGTFRLIHAAHTGLTNVMFAKWNPFKDQPISIMILNGILNTGLLLTKLICLVPYIAVTALHVVANGLIRKAAAAILTVASLLPIAISHGIAKKIQASKANKLAKETVEIDILEKGTYVELNTDHLNKGIVAELTTTTQIKSINQITFNHNKDDTYKVVSFLPNKHFSKYFVFFKLNDPAQKANYESMIKINQTAREKDSDIYPMYPRGFRNNGWLS